MNNLKRVLSLGLASVMLAGSMAFAGAADVANFTDMKDIKNKEAVNAMVALNILKGKEDGSYFAPKDYVSRAEMAKMIFVALNGGKDNNSLTTKATPTYSDIKGNWAEGYIEYCSSLGIISGKGDGTFAPNDTVTGQQAAKMLLIAIGYDAEEAGLSGTVDWGINTDALALNRGFYANVDISTGDLLTRDNAAQIVYDALQACMVEYQYNLIASNGNLANKSVVKDRKYAATTTSAGVTYDDVTILSERYKMKTAKVVLTSIVESKDAGKVVYSLNGTYTKVAGDYSSLLGQKVKVLYKDTDDVFGVYATKDNTVVAATNRKAVGTVTNSSTKIKFGGVEYDTTASNGTVSYIKDGAVQAAVTARSFKTAKNDDAIFNEVTFIDNDGDGKLDIAVETTVVPGKVTYKSSTEIIASGTTYKYADDVIPSDVAKDDFIVARTNPADNNKHTLTKLTATTGSITGTRGASGTTPQEIQVGGTWYNNLNKAENGDEFSAGDNVTAYIVNGTVFSAEATSSTSLTDVAVLVAYNTTGITPQAKILYTDGTTKTVEVDTDKSESYVGSTKTKFSATAPTVGKFFSVSSTSSGYKLVEVKNEDKVGGYTYRNSYSGYDADDKAVVLAYDASGNTKVYTGKQMKNTANWTGLTTNKVAGFTNKVEGLTKFNYVSFYVSAFPGTVTANGDKYAVLTAKSYEVDGGIVYTIWNGTEKVTVTDKDNKNVTWAKNSVISYSSISNGEIKDAKQASTISGWVVGKGKSTEVYLNGSSDTYKYKIDSDTVVLYYDTDGAKGTTTGDIALADSVKVLSSTSGAALGTATEDLYTCNVKFKLSSADELAFLMVDIKNKLADEKNVTVSGSGAGNADTDGVTKAKTGDVITVKLSGNKTVADVTLTGAKFLSGTTSTAKEFKVVATGASNVAISVN